MAITHIGSTAAQSKVSTNSSATGQLSVAAGDLILIAFAGDDIAGSYTPADSIGTTLTLVESVVLAGQVRAYLWYGFIGAFTGNNQASITHPTMTAHVIGFAVFRGATSFDKAGGGSTATGVNATYMTGKTAAADDALLVGWVGWEGPGTDTISTTGLGSGTPQQPAATTPAGAKSGTTGGSATSNITLALAYNIVVGPVSLFNGQAALSTARGSAGVGGIFLPTSGPPARTYALTATGGGVAVLARSSARTRAATVATGGGVVVLARRKSASSTAAGTGGGVLTIASSRAESHFGTAVLSGGGVAVLTRLRAARATVAGTGGGIAVLVRTRATGATLTASGGGVVVIARSHAGRSSLVGSGGGVIRYTYAAGASRSGFVIATGGGTAVLVRTSSRRATATGTGGGVLVATASAAVALNRARSWSVLL